MTHWEFTETIKEESRVLRRRQARAELEDQLSDLQGPVKAIFAKDQNRK